MWISQLSSRQLIDLKSSTYNPSVFCSLHSKAVTTNTNVKSKKGESKSESKSDTQSNIDPNCSFPQYSIACIWKFLDSKTPVTYIFLISISYFLILFFQFLIIIKLYKFE